MLPAHARLRSSSEIAKTLKSGDKFTSKLIVIHISTGMSPTSKVAFAVGKPVGNSVIRHRITRRLRHILSSEISGVPEGSHIVVRALPGTATATFAELQENVRFALAKVRSHG